MKESKSISRRKVGAGLGLTGFMVMVIALLFTMSNIQLVEFDDEGTLHLIGKWSSASAEADPTGVKSGWLSTFALDYGETPGTVLANNATDWSAAGTARCYEDADNQETDCASEDPFYYVVRARFNDTVKDGADFIDTRCYVYLTVSGDETISDVLGTRVVSYNSTGGTFIYVNFYWDDAVDGYRLTDDGSTPWNISIYAQY